MLDDLPDGLLQAVGTQHQLLAWLEDGSGGRGAGPRGAGGGGQSVGQGRERGHDQSLALLLLLSDGGRRRGWRHSGRLRLLVQSLQQRIEFLLQNAALTHKPPVTGTDLNATLTTMLNSIQLIRQWWCTEILEIYKRRTVPSILSSEKNGQQETMVDIKTTDDLNAKDPLLFTFDFAEDMETFLGDCVL